MAGAEDFVQQLPEGMDTVLSDTFAPKAGTGRGLSDGEWNRLELARALMRLDSANLVVLDEPTRDMDSNEAVTFMHRLRSELGPQTAVVIATRSESVSSYADAVCRLDEGRFEENLPDATANDGLNEAGGYEYDYAGEYQEGVPAMAAQDTAPPPAGSVEVDAVDQGAAGGDISRGLGNGDVQVMSADPASAATNMATPPPF